MTKKTSLTVRVFTFVIIALLIGFVFVPSFTVKAEVEAGSATETIFETSVSAKDVLAVAFLDEDAKEERLVKVASEREEAIDKLVLDGKTNAEAVKKVNTYSISKEYALLKFLALEEGASSWLVVAAVVEIVMLVLLVGCALYTYMAIQYDNKEFPKITKILATSAGLAGLVFSLILMFLKNSVDLITTTTALTALGYIVLVLSLYLPVHAFISFRKVYKK